MLGYVTLPCYRRAPVPGPGRGRAAGGGVGQPGHHHHHLLQGEHAAANEFSQQFHEYLLTPLLNMAYGAAVDMVAYAVPVLPHICHIHPNLELKLLQRILNVVASGWFWLIRDCPDCVLK